MKMNNNYTDTISARISRRGLELLTEAHVKTGGTNSALISCAMEFIAANYHDEFIEHISNNIKFGFRGYRNRHD